MENKQMLKKSGGYFIFSLIGVLFFFFTFAGVKLAKEGNIAWTGKYLLGLFGISVLPGILTGGFLCFGIYKWGEVNGAKRIDVKRADAKRTFVRLPRPKHCFLIAWGILFLSWIPAFLAYYPAICSYDITIQIGQIVGNTYNDHHPIAHTLLIALFMKLGSTVFGDTNTGIALLTLLQMLFLSSAFALGIAMLRRRNRHPGIIAVMLLYGMFFPFHLYMSVSITKDTFFSAFMLFQILFLSEILEKRRSDFKIEGWDIGYFLATTGMILFRSNGRYAFAVLLFFLLSAFLFGRSSRLFYGKLLLNSLFGLIAGSILMSVLFNITGAQQGDRREMLSMPIQQLARSMIYHGGVGVLAEDDNTMEEGDKALINDFILNQAYKEYCPDIADPVKSSTNTYVFRYRMKDFMSTYFRLMVQYPGDYLNAVLAVNAGYLSPLDTTHAYINENGKESGLGYIQTRWVAGELAERGIYKDSQWEWLHGKLEWFADENAYLNIPILKYIFVPGTYFWLYLLLAAWLLVFRRFRLLLPLSLVMGYYGTLLLGPTVQLRYLYPVMIILPFLLVQNREGSVAGGSR